MKNLQQVQQMLKQVQQFQEQLQKQLDDLVVESSTGGGMVTVKMNGQKHLVSVHIDPEIYKSGDIEMLQDLLLAAVNESARKVDEQVASQMGSLAGGLNLPGLSF
ncbi:MAG TPA: YbaB/EbfC family nucleoid-associated protein [Terriglobia bacterium]|jgi:DNA-binding YbaB/EbfC family protein|nr:YbaB/EbfC family nucleoid-associated protein [Terriglobia bacterium]